MNRQDTAKNIPFMIGNREILWEKMLKEVQLGRFGGPFDKIPFQDSYVHSPVGLVPKAENKTRLIFHLSYKFKNGNESINFWTPEDKCKVKYNDLDHAIATCLDLQRKYNVKILFFSKSDLMSAFRALPLIPEHRRLFVDGSSESFNW